jgi:hypothetical protein
VSTLSCGTSLVFRPLVSLPSLDSSAASGLAKVLPWSRMLPAQSGTLAQQRSSSQGPSMSRPASAPLLLRAHEPGTPPSFGSLHKSPPAPSPRSISCTRCTSSLPCLVSPHEEVLCALTSTTHNRDCSSGKQPFVHCRYSVSHLRGPSRHFVSSLGICCRLIRFPLPAR